MHPTIRLGVALLVTSFVTGCATVYPLPFQPLKGTQICGRSTCIPGSNGAQFNYKKTVYLPSVEAGSTPQNVASKVVGRMVKESDLSGGTPYRCSTDGSSPFDSADVVPKGSVGGIATRYQREEKLKINVNAEVEADLQAMKQLGLPTSQLSIQDARAKLTAAYSRLSGSTVVYKGHYYEFGLSEAAFQNLFQSQNPAECAKALKEALVTDGEPDRWLLLTEIGLVVFDTQLAEASTAQTVADVETEFASYGVPFDLSAKVDRTIKQQLGAELHDYYAVISARRTSAERFVR